MRKLQNLSQNIWAKPITSATNHAKQHSTKIQPNIHKDILNILGIPVVAARSTEQISVFFALSHFLLSFHSILADNEI
jgi:hypothetical protein